MKRCFECNWKQKDVAAVYQAVEEHEKGLRYRPVHWVCLACWKRLDYESFFRMESIIKMWGYIP